MNHEQIERQDVVERYLLRRLPPEEAQDFEEHYLGCAECCERIREERQIITDIQRACSGWSRRKRQRRFWTLPAPAMGLAAALAAAAVYLSVMTPTVVQRREAPAAQSAALPLPVVELTTYRAGETAGQAKAGAPFRLRLDLHGLAAAGECSIEVVRESGEAAWSRSGVARTAEQTEVDLLNGLPSGAYWVRVSSEGKLLREFGLRVEP